MGPAAGHKLIDGLVRLVSRIGSYTDAGALCSIARDLVRELGLEGAAVWRDRDGTLQFECGEGLAIPDAFAMGVGGKVREEGGMIGWPLLVQGRSLGVLAVRGEVDEPSRQITSMLAGRCAYLLSDAQRAQAQRSLLEGLSHELRAPLQTLLGYVDLLQGGSFGALNDEQAKAVEAIAGSAEKVLSVARDVLSVARIDAGRDRPIVGEVALAEVLRREVEDARPLAEAAGLTLALECPAALHIVSDGAKIGRILANLIGNAIKYTTEGGILVRAAAEGEECLLEVADTGSGVPVEKREAIFEDYVRLDTGREGTGLGLPIARRLAGLLGGTLRMVERNGPGSLFRLTLPPCAP